MRLVLLLSRIVFDYETSTRVCLCLAFCWLLQPEPQVVSFPVPLVEELLLREQYLSPNKDQWLRQMLRVSPATIKSLASSTVGQHKCHIWTAVRKLRFTASKFGDLLKAAAKHR
jgi:hypothetical protein